MHSNEITYNELSAGDFIPNDWGHIDLSSYTDYADDEEVCFKLAVWVLQCKFAEKVGTYFNSLGYGLPCNGLLEDLKVFKMGLEVLNRYDPRDIAGDTTDYNVTTYSTILKILEKLNHNC
jgi:hypothetical protein